MQLFAGQKELETPFHRYGINSRFLSAFASSTNYLQSKNYPKPWFSLRAKGKKIYFNREVDE